MKFRQKGQSSSTTLLLPVSWVFRTHVRSRREKATAHFQGLAQLLINSTEHKPLPPYGRAGGLGLPSLTFSRSQLPRFLRPCLPCSLQSSQRV